MSTPDGEGWHWSLALLKDAVAVGKEVWGAFLLPAVFGWWTWRRWSAGRADERAKEGRTEQQRRDDAFAVTFARVDEKVKQHVAWLEARAERAEKRADEADARADAADAARWRSETYAERHEYALGNARQIADDARAKAVPPLPPVDWKPVPRPTLPGDPP